MIRLATLSRHFSRQAGGAESYAVALVEELANRRGPDGACLYEVHVFSQTRQHQHPNVRYHKVWGPLPHPRWINQWIFAAHTWWQTRKGFDIVHSHENTWHGQVQTVHVRPIRFQLFEGRNAWRRWLRWLKVLSSPRLTFYVWVEAARMKLPRPQSLLAARPAQVAAQLDAHASPAPCPRVLVATSRLLREQTVAAYPHAAGAVVVIEPGVATAQPPAGAAHARSWALQQLGLGGLPLEGAPVILFVANDYARKGLSALLAGMARLQANTTGPSQPHLLVVGGAVGGAQRAHFQTLAAELGVAERVHFLGAQSEMALPYLAADYLVHPTLEDGYAMVVLEAMSYGLPVIVSQQRYCGISQFLVDAEDALLLDDPQDSAALAQAIMLLQMNLALRQKLSSAGLRFAAQHSWRSVASAYAAIYQRIAGK